ncbi:unnamed protein product [Cuscuta epithymum]|uniref:Uncharacterized protein n=1 Tax=Cuscuta epithymum TaxID=186058 RepID=A0AAV0ECG4_9ASTE|nr:unnamed protein product [Cuscuta epithymum]
MSNSPAISGHQSTTTFRPQLSQPHHRAMRPPLPAPYPKHHRRSKSADSKSRSKFDGRKCSFGDRHEEDSNRPYEDEDNCAPHLRQSYCGPTASKNRSKRKKEEEEVSGAANLLEQPGAATTCR